HALGQSWRKNRDLLGHRPRFETKRPDRCGGNREAQRRDCCRSQGRAPSSGGTLIMSKFFIDRPIVAIVISILMVIVGGITITSLPVAQFPNIAPPEIRVSAPYPGADAETLEKAVATPIEQQVNGVDNMDYMYSLNSTNNSTTVLYVDFDLKTD